LKRPDDDIVGNAGQSVKPSSGPASEGVVVAKKPGLILSCQDGHLSLNHSLMEEAFGSKDHGFVNGLMGQIVQMSNVEGKMDPIVLDFIGGALLELKPRNGMEGILVAQIISNHLLAMKFSRLTMVEKAMERAEKLEVMTTKFMRTTTTQMEALHKLRNGGKQKVKVEHVHVYEGGQAIVGNVGKGGGGE
jgi:hypothetical protein